VRCVNGNSSFFSSGAESISSNELFSEPAAPERTDEIAAVKVVLP